MGPQEETVHIIDDDPSILKGLSRLLRAEGHAVETYLSAQAFLMSPWMARPGCLVLDVHLSGLDGLELQETLSVSGHDLPIVFITGSGDIPTSVKAMKAGAVDFLTKPFDDQTLLEAVSQALAKADRRSRSRAEHKVLEDRLSTLTPREREVFDRVVLGRLNKQIALELGAAEKTIKVHRGRVMQKLGVASLAELVRFAARLGGNGEER